MIWLFILLVISVIASAVGAISVAECAEYFGHRYGGGGMKEEKE